jgi:hypothetical protein
VPRTTGAGTDGAETAGLGADGTETVGVGTDGTAGVGTDGTDTLGVGVEGTDTGGIDTLGVDTEGADTGGVRTCGTVTTALTGNDSGEAEPAASTPPQRPAATAATATTTRDARTRPRRVPLPGAITSRRGLPCMSIPIPTDPEHHPRRSAPPDADERPRSVRASMGSFLPWPSEERVPWCPSGGCGR